MAYALLSGAATFLLAVCAGGPLIRWLRGKGIGKTIRVDGPPSHQAKVGTPTMGGLMILLPVLLVTLCSNLLGHRSILLPLGVMAIYGLLGAVDDWSGLHDKTGYGILARQKFPLQLVIALAAAIGLRVFLDLGGMAVPTFREEFDIGWLYVPVAALLIVGSANAVNLTDGLDGLAGGTTAIAYFAFGIIAYLQGQAYLVTFCFTMVGAILAFLWYNVHPAEVFMGDVGSLALGATLATVALMTEQWLLLGVVGIVFVAEAFSDILQVSYFKWTRGKRLFKMAPLHHHFELLGWPETKITQRFWLVAVLAAMLGVALALV
jgi:phospho-N-acetylmuramoyl-pentapeptide-transferase